MKELRNEEMMNLNGGGRVERIIGGGLGTLAGGPKVAAASIAYEIIVEVSNNSYDRTVNRGGVKHNVSYDGSAGLER